MPPADLLERMSAPTGTHAGGAKPGRMRWLLNRLQCMSLPEIRHRIARECNLRIERVRIEGKVRRRMAAVPEADLATEVPPWIAAPTSIDAAPYVTAAERYAAGYFDLFALRGVNLGMRPHWNRDPKTGIEAPLVFGMLFDYRDPAQAGDIKYLWEPNRHQHLVTLAQAYALTGNRRPFDALCRHLTSWLVACPPGLGRNS